MTVWCVMFHDYEGSYLCSIWSTKESAEAHAAKLNTPRKPDYSVEEWVVDVEDQPEEGAIR